MDREEQDDLATRIVVLILLMFVLCLYLFPWMVPLFHAMPEGTTLPYYALLVAIEMTPFVKSLKDDSQKED